MHFGVLIISESNADGVMSYRNYESTADDGADISISCDTEKEDAEEQYTEHIKENPEDIENYPDVDTFMEEFHNMKKDENGDYGYEGNAYGICDWHTIGGRWDNTLPLITDEKILKKALKKAINPSLKEVREKYADNLPELIGLVELPLKDACAKLHIGTGCELKIGDNGITGQDVINFWRSLLSKDEENTSKDYLSDENLIYNLFELIIDDVNGNEYREHNEDFGAKEFITMYDELARQNKEEDREFTLTVVDCHT